MESICSMLILLGGGGIVWIYTSITEVFDGMRETLISELLILFLFYYVKKCRYFLS